MRKLVVFILIAGGIIFSPFLVLAAEAEDLAKNYSPNFWFDSEEEFFPANPLDFYYDKDLNELPGETAKTNYSKLNLEEKLKNFVVYYEKDDFEEDILLKYYLFYVFNPGDLNDHYGDWEWVHIYVDKNTKKINKLIGSAHIGNSKIGKTFLAHNELDSPEQNHINILVERGGHANLPDGNGDGAFDNLNPFKKAKDISNWHNAYGISGWNEKDKLNGAKINYDSLYYKLKPLSCERMGCGKGLKEEFGKDRNLINNAKSPTLGINIINASKVYKVVPELKDKKLYVLENISGKPTADPWYTEAYNNPKSTMPITPQLVGNKVKSLVEKVQNTIQTTIKNINPFSPAALVVQEPAPQRTSDVNAETSEVNTTQEPEPTAAVPELSVENIQETLDNIAERIDTISQETKILVPEIIPEPVTPKPEEKPEAAPEEPPQLADETKEETKEAATQPEVLPRIAEKTIEVTMGAAATVGSKSASSPLPPPPPPPPAEIFITEIQISGASAQDDFIEIYNPVDSAIDISGFQLKKRSSTGKEYSVRLFPQNSVIAGLNYFLWLNSDYNSSSSIEAEVESSQNLAKNNSIALFDKYDRIIDSLAWGTGTDQFLENRSFPDNPEDNSSLARKWSDENNNYTNDFEIQTPTPGAKNQIPIPEPPAPELSVPEPSLSVVINEIAWAGTKANPADEWIEFYNNSASEINIADWTLGSTTFSASQGTTTIPANGFYLLERSDDQSIYDISADYIFTGALSNDGEKLELKDDQNNLIDLVDFSLGWPAGSSTPNYISMERINSSASGSDADNWTNNNSLSRNGTAQKDQLSNHPINGTPKAQNSVSKSFTEITYPFPFNEFDELTLTYLGSPYVFKSNNDVPAEKTLKIEPGVVLKINNKEYLTVNGKIEALGTPEKKITFTANSESPTPGSWSYIHFQNSLGNKLENIIVEYGGLVSYNKSAIFAENSEISIKDSLFQNNHLGGLRLINSTSTIENIEFLNAAPNARTHATPALLIDNGTSTIKNSTFRKNGFALKITRDAQVSVENNVFEENQTPIYLDGPSQTVFSQNTAQNNNIDGILISGSTITSDTIWGGNLPFVIEHGTSVGLDATLTLEAGTVLKISRGALENGGFLDIYGKLIIQGTEENPVIITSLSGFVGNWGGIIFRNSGSVLDGATIKHGQGKCEQNGCWGAINQFSKGVEIEIKNSRIENNVWGILSKEDDCQTALEKIKIENTVFSENVRDIYIPQKIIFCPAP